MKPIKIILFVFVFVVAVGFAVAQIPFPQPPSYAYMERQSGSIPITWMPGKVQEYKALGCTYVGITKITPTVVNVWCVRVEIE